MGTFTRSGLAAAAVAGAVLAVPAAPARAAIRPAIVTVLEMTGLTYPQCVTNGHFIDVTQGGYSYACIQEANGTYDLYITWY